MWHITCHTTVPNFSKLPRSCSLIEIILSAIPFNSTSHCALSSSLVKTLFAILAPWIGGLEYIGRMRIFNWDSTAFASSTDWHTTFSAPIRSPAKRKTYVVIKGSEWKVKCLIRSSGNHAHVEIQAWRHILHGKTHSLPGCMQSPDLFSQCLERIRRHLKTVNIWRTRQFIEKELN